MCDLPSLIVGNVDDRPHQRHLDRLRDFARAVEHDQQSRRRQIRGAPAQSAVRACEASLRRRALAALHRGLAAGDTPCHIAAKLDLDPARLRAWQREHEHRRAQQLPPASLGRRALACSPAMAAQLRHQLAVFGPGIGTRTLRADFPDVAYRDCNQIAWSFRRDLREQFNDCTMVACTWTTPGTVWATDVWEPAVPIDGRYPYILDVRDLASGYIIESMPLENKTAELVGGTLERLHDTIGAPLVIKFDNGGEFTGQGSGDVHTLAGASNNCFPRPTPRNTTAPVKQAMEASATALKCSPAATAGRDAGRSITSKEHAHGRTIWRAVRRDSRPNSALPSESPSATGSATNSAALSLQPDSIAGASASQLRSIRTAPSISRLHHQPSHGRPSPPSCATPDISSPGTFRFVNPFRTKKRPAFRSEHKPRCIGSGPFYAAQAGRLTNAIALIPDCSVGRDRLYDRRWTRPSWNRPRLTIPTPSGSNHDKRSSSLFTKIFDHSPHYQAA
ncbi:MAG: transposase family protein [Planctomycetota bacterium]